MLNWALKGCKLINMAKQKWTNKELGVFSKSILKKRSVLDEEIGAIRKRADEMLKTSSSNAIVISVLSDFRLKLSESIMAVSDNFNILSATGGIQRFINSDAIILVDQFDTLRTDIFCEGGMRIRLGHDTTPSKQSKIVVAFQNAMLRAQTGAGGPEPVVMPSRIYILDTTVTSLPAVS